MDSLLGLVLIFAFGHALLGPLFDRIYDHFLGGRR